ncbi:MAG TPA: hypothetical protein VK063_02485 [Beutenbergiaceae bacterium]|nr:hypothetical protein [Beutenbergiaceae bacterium]
MKRTTTSGATSATVTGARLLGAACATAAGVAALWGAANYLMVLLNSPLRIDTLTTAAVVALGTALATWYTLSTALAALCLLARLSGLVWAGGEAWLHHQGAPLVRRFVSGVGGAALVAGVLTMPAYADAAEQAEPPPVTWTPTDNTSTGDGADDDGDTPGSGPGNGPDVRAHEYRPDGPLTEHEPGPTATDHDQEASAPEADPAPSTAESEATTPTTDGETAPPATEDDQRPPGTEDDPSPPAGEHEATPSAEHETNRPAAHTATTPPSTGLGVAEQPSTAGSEIRVVQPGDTLWSLAAEQLGAGATDAQIAAAWPRWHQENADVIGPDPDLIHPDQALHVPGGSR